MRHRSPNRSARILSVAVALLVGFGATPLSAGALPVSTSESTEHAAFLRQVPAYHDFEQDLGAVDEHDDKKAGRKPQSRLSLMEWYSAKPSPAFLLCVHAWGLSAREYNGFGEEMARRGFDTAAIDVRGFGVRRNEKGLKKIDFEGTISDISQLLRTVRKRNPQKKIFVVGESMGGAIAMRVAADHPELVDGVICSAPAWQIYRIRRITAGGILDRVLGEPGLAANEVVNLASSDPRLKKQWLEDETYRTSYSIPEAYSYYRLMRGTPRNAESIKAVPTLVIQGLHDRLSKPQASARLFKMIDHPSKQFAIVAGREHLVLEEGQLTNSVAAFIQHWIVGQMHKTDDTAAPPVVVIDEDKLPASDSKQVELLKELAGQS